MAQHINSILCLGDSYTIGESVPLHESFPYQLAQLLRKAGHACQAPEIVAQTGWTTFELAEHLIHHKLEEQYDFVTLLVGVNNQYRGLSLKEYKEELGFLIHKAIHFAKGDAKKVILLSIPDWGVTPFAKDRDAEKIAADIDDFNEIKKGLAALNGCHFIEITQGTRNAATNESLLAKDGLHYSGNLHGVWAQQLADVILS